MTTSTATPVVSKTCAWIGNGEGCTHTAIAGRSYCTEHIHLVYQEGTARAGRKKDIKVADAVWDIESEFNAAVQELEEEGFDIAEERWEAVVEDDLV